MLYLLKRIKLKIKWINKWMNVFSKALKFQDCRNPPFQIPQTRTINKDTNSIYKETRKQI